MFKVDAETILARKRTDHTSLSIISMGESITRATGIFTAVSLLVFASWALGGRFLYGHLGEIGAYCVWCVLFLIGSGGLRWSLIGPIPWKSFYAVFTTGFLTYSVGWTICYVWFRNVQGELLGALVGMVGMAAVLCAAFRAWKEFSRVSLFLFLGNVVGYFLGSWAHARLDSPWGELSWGLGYGLGTGIGIGGAFFYCQSELRLLIGEPRAADDETESTEN